MIRVVLDLALTSKTNDHANWHVRASKAKAQRAAAVDALAPTPVPEFPLVVLLTRVAPRALDDDNLRGAFKSVRDGCADWLGVPDNDPRVRWEYNQAKGAPKQTAAVVDVVAECSCVLECREGGSIGRCGLAPRSVLQARVMRLERAQIQPRGDR